MRPELLAPAGGPEALRAAVQCGADAVYLGFGAFNARRNAKNFTEAEFRAAVRYCHGRGVKVYLTLNTLLFDRELTAAAQTAALAGEIGVDAVLVQDLGVLQAVRAAAPDLPLHASTQMTVHNTDGALQARELGLSRVVLAREMTKEQIAAVCALEGMETEVFVHGAHCMCYSGQCSMSALIGSRSGNRGTCAQPCRLPYTLEGQDNRYPLSLKDMSLADHIPELTAMGVSCLKLEGRMKRPEYVAVVTGIYAVLLRENRGPTAAERRDLEAAFSRSGFTGGYFEGKTDASMFGVRGEKTPEPKELFDRARAGYERREHRSVPVSMTLTVRRGTPCRLTVRDNAGRQAESSGPVPEDAHSKPLTAEDLRARLGKTGGTVFEAGEIAVELDEGLSLPAAAVNALRRDALAALEDTRCAPSARRIGTYVFPQKNMPGKRSCPADRIRRPGRTGQRRVAVPFPRPAVCAGGGNCGAAAPRRPSGNALGRTAPHLYGRRPAPSAVPAARGRGAGRCRGGSVQSGPPAPVPGSWTACTGRLRAQCNQFRNASLFAAGGTCLRRGLL